MQLKQTVQTDYEVLEDKVVAAMETGNAGQARLVLAEHAETFPNEVERIRRMVLRQYNTRL